MSAPSLGPPTRPCTLVVAAAGYGKTSLARRLLNGAATDWGPPPEAALTGAELVDLIRHAAAVDAGPRRWLVLDDLPRLTGDDVAAVLRVADGLPERLRLVLVTRHVPPPRPVQAARRRGILATVGPAELAMSPGQVAALLRDEYDLPDPGTVRPVHALTGGWPILVHLLARALAEDPVRGDDLARLLDDDPPGGAYLAREVFAELPADQRRVLRQAAHLDPVAAELCDPARPGRAARPLARLVDAGLLGPAAPGAVGHPVVPLVAAAVRQALPLPAGTVARLHAHSADWYAARDLPAAALRGYRLAGPGAHGDLVRLLKRDGDRLTGAGAARAVAGAVEALAAEVLPGRRQPRWLRRLRADALRNLGESTAAAAGYRTLAGRGDRSPAGVAWRHGLLHYLRGEPGEALTVLERGRLRAERTVDEALLLAWTGAAYAMWGDPAACADRARRALAAADVVPTAAPGRADALVGAHLAASLAAGLTAQPSTVLDHLVEADRAGHGVRDVGLLVWLRISLARARTVEGHCPAALTDAATAVTQAEAVGNPHLLGAALVAEAEVLVRLGRLAEAAGRYQRAVGLYQRIGSPQVAQALAGLGEMHLRWGRHSLARAAYQEAARISEPHGNRPVLVAALTGLARLTASENPAAATALAQRAVALAVGTGEVLARCALGWAALAAGERARVRLLADQAAERARSQHDPAGLAAALELRAEAVDDPHPERAALTEARTIHRDACAHVDADRVTWRLGRVGGAGSAERIDARLAAARLAHAGLSPGGQHPPEAPVTVHTLGRFEVLVAGRPVPTSAWQSRKARDLLRILAARGGRPVSRDQLAELLWPGEEPGRVGHRLSVQLSILRGVLDPRRLAPVDRYVLAERSSMALDVAQMELDVELFRAEASYGLRQFAGGGGQDGHDVLVLAEQRYLGDFLADDPYDDWAVPVRDEARRLYLRVVRALAVLADRRGDLEQASGQLRRALQVEPYDEHTHRELIRVLTMAGRHGEADEAQRRYRRALAMLGLPTGLPHLPARVEVDRRRRQREEGRCPTTDTRCSSGPS